MYTTKTNVQFILPSLVISVYLDHLVSVGLQVHDAPIPQARELFSMFLSSTIRHLHYAFQPSKLAPNTMWLSPAAQAVFPNNACPSRCLVTPVLSLCIFRF